MKRIIALLCALTVIFSLTACGSLNKPEAVVSRFCKALKDFDIEGMRGYIDGYDNIEEGFEENEFLKELYDVIEENAAEIKYDIGEAEIFEDKAKVKVHFVYPDLSEATFKALGEFLTKGFGLAIGGAEDEELEKLFNEVFLEEIRAAEPEIAESDITFHCIKTEEGWKIQDAGDVILDIMTSNILGALDDIEEQLEE